MIHAVFGPDGKVLATVSDAGGLDTCFLADELLRTIYSHVPGAFVDGLCSRHMQPGSSCQPCIAQMTCPRCDWPHLACDEHR